jgi:hypothetical protein
MKRFNVEYWSEEDNTYCVVDTHDMNCVVMLPNKKMAVSKSTAENWAAYYESNPTEAITI